MAASARWQDILCFSDFFVALEQAPLPLRAGPGSLAAQGLVGHFPGGSDPEAGSRAKRRDSVISTVAFPSVD